MTSRVVGRRTRASARGSARVRATGRLSPSLARMPSSTNWAAIEAWSRPGRKSARWPRIRACRIIRSSTAVRWAWPRWSEPVTLGGGWMIVNGGQRRVGGRAGAVGREDVRREPALVDRALDIVRRIGLRQHPVIVWLLGNRTARSSSGRTGRGTTCWFGVGSGRSSRLGLAPTPSRRAIGRLPHGSRATFTSVVPARLAPSRARSGAVPSLLFSVIAVRAGV